MASSIQDFAERECVRLARERPTPSEPDADSFRRWVNRRWPSRAKFETKPQ